jgi:nucleoside-diphosphate-sugar epimerase
MNILVTGSTGFLGRTIVQFLEGNDIITLGRSSCSIVCDLSEMIPINIPEVKLVIHAAGRAHCGTRSQADKDMYYKVNVNGTKNLLLGLERTGIPERFVFISSVAVYGRDSGLDINESSPVMAMDAYGLSKIHAENLVLDWCKKYNVTCTILRLPLVLGTNPPGNLGVLINSIRNGYYFNIDGGKAKKSMVLADDIAGFIIKVSKVGGVFNLTDGYHPSFGELTFQISRQLGKRKPRNIPFWFAKSLAFLCEILCKDAYFNTGKLIKMTSDLTFDDSKARETFGWDPTPALIGFKVE